MDTTKPKKKSNIRSILIMAIVIIVVAYVSSAKHTPVSTQTVDNSAALQSCIDTNVKPIQHLADIGPSQDIQGEVNNAQVALDACKAEYPTN